MDQYPGEWLALEWDKLLAHGSELADVGTASRRWRTISIAPSVQIMTQASLVAVILTYGDKTEKVSAKFETGSDSCVFTYDVAMQAYHSKPAFADLRHTATK